MPLPTNEALKEAVEKFARDADAAVPLLDQALNQGPLLTGFSQLSDDMARRAEQAYAQGKGLTLGEGDEVEPLVVETGEGESVPALPVFTSLQSWQALSQGEGSAVALDPASAAQLAGVIGCPFLVIDPAESGIQVPLDHFAALLGMEFRAEGPAPGQSDQA